MPYRLMSKEAEAVSALPPQQRLTHLVKRVADWEEIWSLRNSEGWVMSQMLSGQVATPFWPHPDYAKLCAQGPWKDCEPASVLLNEFLEKCIPGLKRDCRYVDAFPTPSEPGRMLSPEDMLALLKAECQEAYGDDL